MHVHYAESHVDRSITDPLAFVKTNVIGMMNLLNAAKTIWKDIWKASDFYHISTDEVYGSLGAEGLFTETTAYDPNSVFCLESKFRSFCACMAKPMVLCVDQLL
jgi:dTDP-glucose 4,6-dehydratase